jgi:hypothetical protein
MSLSEGPDVWLRKGAVFVTVAQRHAHPPHIQCSCQLIGCVNRSEPSPSHLPKRPTGPIQPDAGFGLCGSVLIPEGAAAPFQTWERVHGVNVWGDSPGSWHGRIAPSLDRP